MKNASVATRALVFGAVLTVGFAVVGSLIGFLVAGSSGILSALTGAGLTALFMGVTALSVVLASRATRDKPSSGLYFGIVLGMWVIKFVAFVALLLLVRGQQWMNPYVFFVAVVAAVIGSLLADVVALKGARVPYVGDIELPSSTPPVSESQRRST